MEARTEKPIKLKPISDQKRQNQSGFKLRKEKKSMNERLHLWLEELTKKNKTSLLKKSDIQELNSARTKVIPQNRILEELPKRSVLHGAISFVNRENPLENRGLIQPLMMKSHLFLLGGYGISLKNTLDIFDLNTN